jgi:hypothetical protein
LGEAVVGELSASREKEKAYTEIAEDAEFTEKRDPGPRWGKKFSVISFQLSVSEKRDPRAQSRVTVPQRREPKTQFENRTWSTRPIVLECQYRLR